MPKTNIVYGKKYRPCPCAQIHEHKTLDNTYFTAVCYSPKVIRKEIENSGQVRVCMGGTTNNKRYTSCPYYVRNADIKVPKRTRSNSDGNIIYHLIGWLACWISAKSCLNSESEYATIFALMFFILGIVCIVTLIKKDEKIDSKKRKEKKNRR